MSKKQLIQEINRTREIMGLSIIIEQTSTGGTEDNSSVFADTDIDIDKKVKKPSARQLKKELKNKWKFEVFNIFGSFLISNYTTKIEILFQTTKIILLYFNCG